MARKIVANPEPQVIPVMKTALSLARRGLGQVWPNPAVGCVIVRDGRIVGRGWTQPGGRPHAETEALRQAGMRARGGTAYVTLEPCAHHGQTPPCAQALIDAGIACTVIACEDPDPRVAGQGIAMLRAAGIDVRTGVLEAEARALNAGFFLRLQDDRPLVSLKLATSQDEKLTTGTDTQWLTGTRARCYGHGLRARYDAILVGITTALVDAPRLTCRLPGLFARSPVRIVLDREAALPPSHSLFEDIATAPLWVCHGPEASPERVQPLQAAGAICLNVESVREVMAPQALLRVLAGKGITRLLVEGGSRVATAFFEAGVIDRFYWFRAPIHVGEGGLAALAQGSVPDAIARKRLTRQRTVLLGEDRLDIFARAA